MKPSFLLTISPELQRNIWLELTPMRLIGLVLILSLIIAGVHESHEMIPLAGTLRTVIWIVLILWGTRMAAESLTQELSGRTWDVQRLSAQSATGLVLGKLAGGTIFAWIAALLCVTAMFAFARTGTILLPDLLAEGLLAQTSTLFFALGISRFASGQRRVSTLGAQIIGILFATGFSVIASHVLNDLPSPVTAFLHIGETIDWYGMPIGLIRLTRILGVLTSAWMVIGMIRLMRRELGHRDVPVAWGCFTIFLIVLDCGFSPGVAPGELVSASWQMNAFRTVYLITYVALLGMPISIASLRRVVLFASAGNWLEVARETPPWIVSLLITIATGTLCVLTGLDHAYAAIAALGFMCRDALMVYGCRLYYRRRSGAGLLAYFGIAYLFLPFVLASSQAVDNFATPEWSTVQYFIPRITGSTLIGAIAPWVEMLAVIGIFARTFLKILKPIEAEAPIVSP